MTARWEIEKDRGGSYDWILYGVSGAVVATGFAWTKWGARRQVDRAARSYNRTGDARAHERWKGSA